MKVDGISGKNIHTKSSIKEKKVEGSKFSTMLDLENKEQTEQELKKMLDDIEIIGKRLASTRSLKDAKEYKQKIQKYLSFVVKNAYKLKKEPGPFNYGIHIKIEVINEKLDEMTKELINKEKDNIDIADKIEEIRGLIVDVYK